MIDTQQSTGAPPPAQSTMTRTQDEIAARARALRDKGNIFEFGSEVLLGLLDAEHFAEFAKPDADLSDMPIDDAQQVPVEAERYLAFAFGKATDHRGISAVRSVQKMTEYAWLQGRDDVAEQVRDADHAQYGVPALLVYAAAFGSPVPDDEAIRRMGEGEPCEPGCDEGCDS